MTSRIRTVKPEFFSSADIVSLSPLARLLFIALWCEADREGRLRWRLPNIKLRYFPGDDCDVEVLATELIDIGLIVLYGEGLAWIPTFTKHQHVNPREAASSLPEPDASARVDDASARVGTRGARACGKGKEHAWKRTDDASVTRRDAAPSVPLKHARLHSRSKGSRLPEDWMPGDDLMAWAREQCPNIDVHKEVEKFRNYWHAKPGKGAYKLDWSLTFKNWMINARDNGSRVPVPVTERPPVPDLTGGGV